MNHLRVRLALILGKRAFFAFGMVTLLVAGLLAAINLASHYTDERRHLNDAAVFEYVSP